ncbi:MAG TPA: response regulator, partial [Polyangiaceae bacterium]|nr:response regulator [Polyangiaceae bacterium]
VDAADNGTQALETLERQAAIGQGYSVALFDAHMPGMDGFELAAKMQERPTLAQTRRVMMTLMGQRGDAARCTALGVNAYLRKPVKEAELLGTLATVMGPPAEGAAPPLVTQHTLKESFRGLDILVAEDNAVNQKLITKLLESMGHRVAVVDNGAAAVSAVETQRFDLVLMDVQMPVMDGLSATAAIRERERSRGGRVPIVALTANALKGDRERCLEAGMNDFLTKPIRKEALTEVLGQWMNIGSGAANGTASLPVAARSASFMVADALARTSGDPELLREIVNMVLEDAPKQFAALASARDRGDTTEIKRVAHALRGAVSNVGAQSMVAAIQELEAVARGGTAEDCGPPLARAQNAWHDLERELHEWSEAR